jgi:hypothetical protein
MNRYWEVKVHLQEFLTSALPLSKWSASRHGHPTLKAKAAVVIGEEAGYHPLPQPDWTLWGTENSVPQFRIQCRFLCPPFRNLITVTTEL